MIDLWTDGSYYHHPSGGGWAYHLVSHHDHSRTDSGHLQCTNSHQAEIEAVWQGLRALGDRPAAVTLYTDCAYVFTILTGRDMGGACCRPRRMRRLYPQDTQLAALYHQLHQLQVRRARGNEPEHRTVHQLAGQAARAGRLLAMRPTPTLQHRTSYVGSPD